MPGTALLLVLAAGVYFIGPRLNSSLNTSVGFSDSSQKAEGQPLVTLQHDKTVRSVTFSPDGNLIATASGNDTDTTAELKLWNASNGELQRTMGESYGRLTVFSPDSNSIAIQGKKGLELRDVQTGELLRTIEEVENSSHDWSFSPDGKVLAVGINGRNGSLIAIYDVATGERIQIFQPSREISDFAFSSDGKYIVCGGGNRGIEVWDVKTAKVHTHAQPASSTYSGGSTQLITILPDSQTVLTNSGDGIQFWDMETGELKNTLGDDAKFAKEPVVMSPDGKSLAGWLSYNSKGDSSNTLSVMLWATETGEFTQALNTWKPKERTAFTPPTFSPDGRTVAVGYDKVVEILSIDQSNSSNVSEIRQDLTFQEDKATCQNHLKQLALAAHQLRLQNKNRFAFTQSNFKDALMPYIKDAAPFHCPVDSSSSFEGYSFNKNLEDVDAGQIDGYSHEVILFYEGQGENFDFRHGGGTNVVFADGHVKFYRESSPDLKTLRWKP
jgi:prepilin-type processing-associated H-X9-DG protein